MEASASSHIREEENGRVITDLESEMDEKIVTPDGAGPSSTVKKGDEFENDDGNDLNADSEEMDEEENFLCSIEKLKEEVEEDDARAHPLQPHNPEDAPRLLKGALKDGVVKADDSETEEDEKKEAGTDLQDSDMKQDAHEHHVHSRVRLSLFV